MRRFNRQTDSLLRVRQPCESWTNCVVHMPFDVFVVQCSFRITSSIVQTLYALNQCGAFRRLVRLSACISSSPVLYLLRTELYVTRRHGCEVTSVEILCLGAGGLGAPVSHSDTVAGQTPLKHLHRTRFVELGQALA